MYDIDVWLSKNLHEAASLNTPGLNEPCLFLTIIWRLWTTRCKFVFIENDDDAPISEYALIRNITNSEKEIYDSYSRPNAAPTDGRMISWLPPEQAFLKVKTDGASVANKGISGAGGVIRDEFWKCILGFRAHLGTCTKMVAELQAIR